MVRLLRSVVRGVLVEARYRLSQPKPGRVLFDHLPKCGGTTVTRYLRLNYARRVVFQTDGRRPANSVAKFRLLPKAERYRYRLVSGHGAHRLLDYVHPDTLAVTILRDPIQRVISHYYYVRQAKQHYLHRAIVEGGVTLEGYVSSGLSAEVRNWYTTHFSGLSIEEAERDPDRAVTLACETIRDRYQIVGFLDDLATAMARLRQQAKLCTAFAPDVALNRSRTRPALDVLPVATLKSIAEANALDVRLYEVLKSKIG
jgi:hypothetical protein